MAHRHNFGPIVRVALQFYTMKGAKRDMEIILMVFLKKNLIQGNLVILAQKWNVVITLDLLSGFFNKHNRGQEVHKNFISCSLRKKSPLGQFNLFRWVFYSKLSQATVTIGSLNSQDMNMIVYQSGHDFSGKSLYDGYLWALYVVMFRGQYSTEGRIVFWKSIFKNLLRNFVWM